jgi:hypothetical protein
MQVSTARGSDRVTAATFSGSDDQDPVATARGPDLYRNRSYLQPRCWQIHEFCMQLSSSHSKPLRVDRGLIYLMIIDQTNFPV